MICWDFNLATKVANLATLLTTACWSQSREPPPLHPSPPTPECSQQQTDFIMSKYLNLWYFKCCGLYQQQTMINSANKSSICFLFGQTGISVMCELLLGDVVGPVSSLPSLALLVVVRFSIMRHYTLYVTFQMLWPLSTTNCGGFYK